MPNWIKLDTFMAVPPQFEAPWHMLIDVFEHVDRLRITATGEWQPLPGLAIKCGPDGFGGLAVADSALILPGCPVGALIGKFGGSSASLDATAAPAGGEAGSPAAFAIGAHCVVARPKDVLGPLFLGFNTRARPLTIDDFTVQVEGTTLGGQ